MGVRGYYDGLEMTLCQPALTLVLAIWYLVIHSTWRVGTVKRDLDCSLLKALSVSSKTSDLAVAVD
jgi:hypothetical protein